MISIGRQFAAGRTEVQMKTSAPVVVPFVGLVLVVLTTAWTAPRQADAVARDELSSETVLAPFEYFPGRFVSKASEDSEHIQAF
jgi:uncharacterized membrane protein